MSGALGGEAAAGAAEAHTTTPKGSPYVLAALPPGMLTLSALAPLARLVAEHHPGARRGGARNATSNYLQVAIPWHRVADLFEGEKARGGAAFYVARSYVRYRADDKHQPTVESLREGKHFHCVHGPEDKRLGAAQQQQQPASPTSTSDALQGQEQLLVPVGPEPDGKDTMTAMLMGSAAPSPPQPATRPKTGKGSRRGKVERGESVRVGCPMSFIVKRPYLQQDVAVVKWKPECQYHRNHGSEHQAQQQQAQAQQQQEHAPSAIATSSTAPTNSTAHAQAPGPWRHVQAAGMHSQQQLHQRQFQQQQRQQHHTTTATSTPPAHTAGSVLVPGLLPPLPGDGAAVNGGHGMPLQLTPGAATSPAAREAPDAMPPPRPMRPGARSKAQGDKAADPQTALLTALIEFITKAERSPAFMQAAIAAIASANTALDRLREQMEHDRRMNPLALGEWKRARKDRKGAKAEPDTKLSVAKVPTPLSQLQPEEQQQPQQPVGAITSSTGNNSSSNRAKRSRTASALTAALAKRRGSNQLVSEQQHQSAPSLPPPPQQQQSQQSILIPNITAMASPTNVLVPQHLLQPQLAQHQQPQQQQPQQSQQQQQQNYSVGMQAPVPPVGGGCLAALLEALSEPGSVSMHSF